MRITKTLTYITERLAFDEEGAERAAAEDWQEDLKAHAKDSHDGYLCATRFAEALYMLVDDWSEVRRRLCRVCCPPPFMAKTAALPLCVLSTFMAKTAALPLCVLSTFMAKTAALPCVCCPPPSMAKTAALPLCVLSTACHG